MIPLEGASIAVVGEAIGFHDYSLRQPKEIDEITRDQDIHGRRRKVRPPTQGKEIHLER
jgi:hypothetical protein